MFEKHAMTSHRVTTSKQPAYVWGSYMLGWWTILSIILLGSAAPIWAMETQAKETQPKGAQPPPTVEILHVQETTPNVRVFLRWTEEGELPENARASVVDVFGAEVSSIWINAPEPGLSEVTLPEALVDLIPRGTHYEVRLEDEAGEALGTPLAYRVTLRCDEPGHCQLKVYAGLDAPDTLLMSKQLENALEQAMATGTKDPLDWVASKHPKLWGEARTLAWDLDMLEQRFPSKSGCSCRFITQTTHWNDACTGCGAAHYLAVLLRPDIDPWGGFSGRLAARSAGAPGLTDYFEINGGTELRVTASCWQVTPGVDVPVSIEAEEWQGDGFLPSVLLGNCNQECVSSVTYGAEVPIEVHVEADLGYAYAIDTAHFEVAGTPVFQYGLIASTPYQGGNDTKQQTWSGQATTGLGQPAYLETQGIVDLRQTGGAEAYGWVDSQFTLDASAASTCTGPADVDVGVKLDLDFSGSGASINVLIAKVDG